APPFGKKANGAATLLMPQPLYDPERFNQMIRETRELCGSDGVLERLPILVGIMPLLSERNAEYLHSEVPAIVLTDEARRRMKGLSGPEGRKMGMRICQELMDLMVDRADGFYI